MQGTVMDAALGGVIDRGRERFDECRDIAKRHGSTLAQHDVK